jgi:NAD-dependent DNA ligase
MNFRNVAEKTLDKIIDFYGYKALLDWADGEIDFQQTKIGYPQDVGQKTIDSFKKDGIKNIGLVRLIMSDKRYAGKKYNEVEKTESISSNGKSVCFTGALETMTRKEASALAEKNGFTVAGGVSKTLSYLVTNTPDSGSSKNRAAQKFGTKIITEKDFLAMCNR